MARRYKFTKKLLADLHLRESSKGHYEYIGPNRENNRPKNKSNRKES